MVELTISIPSYERPEKLCVSAENISAPEVKEAL